MQTALNVLQQLAQAVSTLGENELKEFAGTEEVSYY